MYISHILKSGQVSFIFLVFRATCSTVVAHRNYSFILYSPMEEILRVKVKFSEESNHCRRVIEAGKLTYDNRTKESIFFQKPCCRDFWLMANSICNKVKSAVFPLFVFWTCWILHLVRQRLFAESISENPTLMTDEVFCLLTLLKLNGNWKSLQLPRWLKRS